MARGGRGGGRGGRGAAAQLPSGWGIMEEPDPRPMELFPPYTPSPQTPLTPHETRSTLSFLRFRRLCRGGPLYTAHRGGGARPKTYSQEQKNALYAVESKASVDPFTAVETWDSKMANTTPRTVPDFGRMAFCKSSFPKELHDTVDPSSRTRGKKGQTDWFGDGDVAMADALDPSLSVQQRLDQLARRYNDDDNAGDGRGANPDEDEGDEEAVEDDDVEYDDDDAGDYEAEAYFDGGDDLDDGGGGGDEPDF